VKSIASFAENRALAERSGIFVPGLGFHTETASGMEFDRQRLPSLFQPESLWSSIQIAGDG
jgi:hypothetical protein